MHLECTYGLAIMIITHKVGKRSTTISTLSNISQNVALLSRYVLVSDHVFASDVTGVRVVQSIS